MRQVVVAPIQKRTMSRLQRAESSWSEPTVGSLIGGSMEEDLLRIKANKAGLHAFVSRTNTDIDHTVYYIRMEYFEVRNEFLEPVAWETSTRYSEVEKFLVELKERRAIQLPALPRKRMMSSLTQDAIDERKRGIDTILGALLPLHAGVPQVRRFLELEVPTLPDRPA